METKKYVYKPYKGSAGPTKEQAEANTKALGEALGELGIPFNYDREYSQEMWGDDDLNLKITHPKTNETAYVGYDRWGFEISEIDCDIEQLTFPEAVNFIEKWYNN